jgi:two-component system NtrC family sensor kinase
MIEKKAAVHGISIFQNINDISGAKGKIHGDPSRLQQVLLNLFNNAMDAIIERHGASGGKLFVEAFQSDHKTIKLRVKDNGCGIRPENINKIFSPFFTTKPVGKGTGLGLSVCYGIIENMGGSMDVSSEVGVGTVFSILLPAKM